MGRLKTPNPDLFAKIEARLWHQNTDPPAPSLN
jgi:hypothetical protein